MSDDNTVANNAATTPGWGSATLDTFSGMPDSPAVPMIADDPVRRRLEERGEISLLKNMAPAASEEPTEQGSAVPDAAEVEGERTEVAMLPSVGSPVTYYPRAGEARGGRVMFPAFVMGQHASDGRLDVLVFRAHDDVVEVPNIPQRGDADNGRGTWDFSERPTAQGLAIASLTRSLHEMREQMARLEKQNYDLHHRLETVESAPKSGMRTKITQKNSKTGTRKK